MGLSASDVVERARAADVRLVRLLYTDILGVIKGVGVPADTLPRVLEQGLMIDGSSVEGFVRTEEVDVFLRPDPDTWVLLPPEVGGREGGGQTAILLCDVYMPDGSAFAGCPRTTLKRVLHEAEAMGYRMRMGAEPEFFLFQHDGDGKPSVRTLDQAGYFDLVPADAGEEACRAMVAALNAMGLAVESTHHEVAPGQHEIDLGVNDALTTADHLTIFRYLVRAVAPLYGVHATFMPKPIAGINGSGLHLHQSLWEGETNAFFDPRHPEGISRLASRYIAGLIRHARGMTAVTSPLVNSYKRLVPGYEAPVYIAWSMANRSPMIRVPAARGEATRIELRSPDPATNPYLTAAVSLKAGLDGIRHRLDAPPPVTRNLYRMSEAERQEMGIEYLPTSLEEALNELTEDDVVREALGEYIFHRFVEAKRIEWDVYRMQVHDWEREQYLSLY
ncbi:glutamine synthetase [Candidatus Hydrogenisulfobacillus filiaventi]|uniref:Glutamine synthetase n=1 Tax=Candidatus Hydrogenisulfobacillus filiaventi TaxID=2707344 RepID=A0A6F8ZK22_9FIRM|nr:glutamine synthetase [Candidatus Hydrogenisulfobacillus filiaventi]